jgi:hypothetical protein
VVHAHERLRVGDAIPELERSRVQRRRLAVGVHGLRGLRGPDARGERLRLVPGGVVVVRDPRRQVGAAMRGHALGAPLQRAREREVQLGALAGQQVVDDDLAQQRVAERVAAFLVGDHELGGDGFAHRVAQRARVDPGGLGEDRVIQPPAGCEHPQRLLGVRGQPLDPQHQRVAQGRRERAAPVRAGGEQFLGEQRVALRA